MSTDPTPTPIDLDAIRAREQAATPGPWTLRDGFGPTRDSLMQFARIANAAGATVLEEPYTGRDVAALRADAEFIAAARADVPRLLAEVDRLTTELESTRVDLRATEQACDALREQLHPTPAKPSIDLPDPWADRPYVEPDEPNLDAEYAGRMDAADRAARAEDAERTGHGPRCQCEICRYIMTHHQDSEFVRDAIARQGVS